MSSTTTESEDGMLPKDKADTPSINEGSCGGSFGGETVLKKGPWTSAEDAILVDYVKKHGEGNWNAVQKHSGLSRCGKSCRLRWANHLRPNLKKGAFTSEEERLIVELHAKMGNKWARMAAHLPGRTDNEIKNYWNTRVKRRQRAGLPLYPPEFCSQGSHENQQIRNTNNFNNGDTHHIMQANHFDIPEIKFNNLNSNQGVLSYAPRLPDISIGNMLNQPLGSSRSYGFMPTTMHPAKRLRGSEILLPGFNNRVTNGFLPIEFQNDTRRTANQHFGLCFPYDLDPNGKNPSTFGMMHGSHAVSNVNLSTSKPPLGSLKLELPSFQYPETGLGDWGTSSPLLPSLESVDAFIQSPRSPTRLMQSDCVSPQNSGLLDALIHESQTLSCARNQSSEKSSNSCVVTPGDVADSSALNICETEWEGYGDPISPLGRSAASIFSERTPLSGSPLDDYTAPRPSSVFSAGSEVKQEPTELTTPEEERQVPTRLSCFQRPDALLNGGWYDQSSEYATSTFFGEDICGDYKQLSAESASSNQGWNAQTYSWNNLPPVYQMSELP